ncbi:MAG: hypothetical protein HKO76_01115 [Acidimicrobiia bacterium]|nr:hypothetical protein [Acidimicrobiia bacterium]
MTNWTARQHATDLITKCLYEGDLYTAKKMIEIFRLLTGDMPQSPGVEKLFNADELPGVEWASPVERDPNKVFCVVTGEFSEPDVIIEEEKEEHGQRGADRLLDGAEAHKGGRRLQPPGKGKT